jgi:hypothetical protein
VIGIRPGLSSATESGAAFLFQRDVQALGQLSEGIRRAAEEGVFLSEAIELLSAALT